MPLPTGVATRVERPACPGRAPGRAVAASQRATARHYGRLRDSGCTTVRPRCPGRVRPEGEGCPMPERLDVRRGPPRPAGPPPRPAARRRPSPALRTVQVLLVVVSMVVFGGTWYAWSQLARLSGLTTADVIGK